MAVVAAAAVAVGSVAAIAHAQGDGDLDIRLADVCSRAVAGAQRVFDLELRLQDSEVSWDGVMAVEDLVPLRDFYDSTLAYCRSHGIAAEIDDAEGDA